MGTSSALESLMECISKIELKKKKQSKKEMHSVHEKRFSILVDEEEGTKEMTCYYKIIKEIADDFFFLFPELCFSHV